MAQLDTNMRVLRPSRKAVRPGDLFAIGLPDGTFIFGRVISTDAKWTQAVDAAPAILVYVYRLRSPAKTLPNVHDLRPDDLLVPPIMTNRLAWTRGYFETLGNIPLAPSDVLPVHSFFSPSRRRYFDDAGNELSAVHEPVGDYTLHSFRTIDDRVSDALGIPRAS